MKFEISNLKFKIFGVVTSLILGLPSSALAATLTLSPASGTVNRSCDFYLDINLDTQGVQTDGTDAILRYDVSKFSTGTQRITPNLSVYPDFPGNNVDTTEGKITISGLASVSTPFTGQGKLATIGFSVLPNAQATATSISFEFNPNDKANTTDSNVVQRDTVADVLSQALPANLTVGTGTCTTQTVPTTPSTITTTPQGQATSFTQTAPGIASPAAQPNTIDQVVDSTGKGPGTPQLTFTLAIIGSILTVLGVLGLAIL